VDGQNIPCATLRRKWSWIISIYLWNKYLDDRLRSSQFFILLVLLLAREVVLVLQRTAGEVVLVMQRIAGEVVLMAQRTCRTGPR
jgi:hypothetical protein